MNRNSSWYLLAKVAASQHGVFDRAQAAECGLDAQKLRRAADGGRVRRVLSDVFAFNSSPETWLQRHKVVDLAGGVVSHASAAALHDLDGFDRTGSTVDVSFERGRERTLPMARVHRWRRTSASDITIVEGIRCTSVAKTLCQLGSICSRAEVEVALDSALRAGANPAWIEDTAVRLGRPGRTGGKVLFDLMYDPARGGALSESVLEKLIERVLAEPRLPRAVRQHRIELPAGERRVDLAYPDAKLAVEGHSRRHHFGQANEDDDAFRDLELAAVGWEVIYVTWKLAHQPTKLLEMVVAAYQTRRALLAGAA